MDFLLDKAALKGLSEEDQKYVKDEALSKFLLGSVFGGRGIASGYEAVQNIIPGMQKQRQQQGLLSELQAINKDFFPTAEQATQKAYANLPENTSFDYNPTPEAAYRQQQILNTTPDYGALQTRLAQLALTPGAAPLVPGLASAFGAFKPNVTDGVVTDIRNRPTAVIPRADLKTGLSLTGDVQDGRINFETGPIAGFRSATARNTLTPLATNQEYVYDVNQNPIGVRTATGGIQSLTDIEAAKAIGQAAGQVEKVINPNRTESLVSRASLLGQPNSRIGANQPTQGGTTQGASVGGGNITKISPSEETLNAAAKERFTNFSNTSLAGAESAGGRKLAAQQLYDLSTRIQNNKLTGLQAGAYGYMNVIPGIGKFFEQDITDVTRMNQAIAAAQLEKTAQQKGAASNLDAQVIARGYATLTDPAAATRMLAAQEVALADKDIARNQFVETYAGNPSQISTAWGNSPDNKPIFTHPKFNQFLTEQVNSWNQAGAKGQPVLPAGFSFGSSKKSGQFLIKRPDGSVYSVGQ
jgi:hypothetical protein